MISSYLSLSIIFHPLRPPLLLTLLLSLSQSKYFTPSSIPKMKIRCIASSHENVASLLFLCKKLFYIATQWATYVFVTVLFIRAETQYQYDVQTARRRVRATALRAPLQLSNEKVEFRLPATYFDLKIEDFAGRLKVSLGKEIAINFLVWELNFNSPSINGHFKWRIFSIPSKADDGVR